MHDVNYTEELLVGNSANGYRDLLAVIDLSTFRRIPWEEDIPFFLVTFVVPETGKRLEVDPRSILDLTVAKAVELGQWKCIAGLELEVRKPRTERSSSLTCSVFPISRDTQKHKPKGVQQIGTSHPGKWVTYNLFSRMSWLSGIVHGYSLIRPALFAKYHHALYDEALRFGIDIEAHRECPFTKDSRLNKQIQKPVLGFTRPLWLTPRPNGWPTTLSCSSSSRKV